MNITEYILSDNNKCKCDNVDLIIDEKRLFRNKVRSKNPLTNLMFDSLLGPERVKWRMAYNANCRNCGKLYVSFESKKRAKKFILQFNEGMNSGI